MKFLVTYDIKDDKRRKKISDALEGFGYRVNYSVFECELNESKKRRLVDSLEKLIDKKSDSLRFYYLCENCLPKCFECCERGDIFEKHDFFI